MLEGSGGPGLGLRQHSDRYRWTHPRPLGRNQYAVEALGLLESLRRFLAIRRYRSWVSHGTALSTDLHLSSYDLG